MEMTAAATFRMSSCPTVGPGLPAPALCVRGYSKWASLMTVVLLLPHRKLIRSGHQGGPSTWEDYRMTAAPAMVSASYMYRHAPSASLTSQRWVTYVIHDRCWCGAIAPYACSLPS